MDTEAKAEGLKGKVEQSLKRLLKEKAKEINLDILALEIMPDHVHLFVNAPPNLAADQIMHWLNGYTARRLRQTYSHLRRMPSMWTRSYFVSTAGNVSPETIRKFIAQQSTRA